MNNLEICHTDKDNWLIREGGRCICAADEDGRDIREIAAEDDCPLGKFLSQLTPEQRGAIQRKKIDRRAKLDAVTSALWIELHERRWEDFTDADNRLWFNAWIARVPNHGCSCRDKLKALLASLPLIPSFEYTVHLHNAVTVLVNDQRRESKPLWTLQQARNFYHGFHG